MIDSQVNGKHKRGRISVRVPSIWTALKTSQPFESPPADIPSPQLKRSSTFKIPLKVNTDPSLSTFNNRSRASSLEQSPPEKRHAYKSSLGSIPSATKPPENPQPRVDPPRPTRQSSSDQFSAATKEPLTYTPVNEESPTASTPPRPLQDRPSPDSTMSSQPTKVDTQAYAAPPNANSATTRVNLPGLPGPNIPLPNISGQANGVIGNLLKGPVTADGKLKEAALMVGIKLDLEAEVHITARVRGDILVGLY
ncbi:hypothetical protein QBC33DRAFT_566093 [Phialemonium atrogriseum]|uniref:Uncharacterized protein n=1 Tax=Phialemonium atrogriseum TaxID=1093897 RepID=A0AAJ0C9E8_9PEZI|nr:uncharacterized protein QBC33DRAFT_566093 [Phialemonium atrogriseum]KAK1771962.1 hypothetical protein QBC33DRAFT_566093 [Phialemonium atrogriseum]